MSGWQWFLVVFVGYFLTLLVLRALNKDTMGALVLVTALYLLGLVLFSVSGCTVSPERVPYLEAGFAYDTQRTVGSNPACVVRLRQNIGFGPLPADALIAGYTHHSSCRDVFDANTIDQFEVVAKIPLGRSR